MTSKVKNTLLLLVIIGVATVYSLSGKNIGMNLDFGETSFAIRAGDYSEIIPYSSIESIELVPTPESGNMISGAETRRLRYGTWRNDTWGEYRQCINTETNQCIQLSLSENAVYVLNYQDDNSTVSLFNMLTELLQDKNCRGDTA